MKGHTLIGRDILADAGSDLLDVAAAIALTHHERVDGCGYPRGIGGDEIPVEGRIVCVADSFDAMISDRPYRSAMSLDDAVDELARGRGTQFDPEIAELLIDHAEEFKEIGRRADEVTAHGPGNNGHAEPSGQQRA
jgi:HD-GYP domain-containing protein (c-di-GMP phosphodiesterase class II)